MSWLGSLAVLLERNGSRWRLIVLRRRYHWHFASSRGEGWDSGPHVNTIMLPPWTLKALVNNFFKPAIFHQLAIFAFYQLLLSDIER